MKKGLRSKNVLTAAGMRSALLIIENGKIAGIENYSYETDFEVDDYGELVVMPGIVDTHVHINEPGREHWEGFETGTKSAAAGGVTSIVDMPLNSIPATISPAALEEKIKSAEGKLYVDCGFYGGIIPGNEMELKGLIRDGVFGFKAFMIDSGVAEFPNVSEKDLQLALEEISGNCEMDLPLLVHAELESPVESLNGSANSFQSFVKTRPDKWETDAISVLIKLSKEFRHHIHIVHVSSAKSIDMIRKAKESGIKITAETCPHYLFFSSEEIPDGDTRFKCTPPIRSRENKEKLWSALKEGVIDFIVSDHSPCSADLKCLEEGNFQKAWGGISSLQLSLHSVWTEANKRGITLNDVSRMMSLKTSEFIGYENSKGKIAKGYDADLVVFNPEGRTVADENNLSCRNKITPYHGMEMQGTVESTYLRGEKIYSRGLFFSPKGKVIRNSLNSIN